MTKEPQEEITNRDIWREINRLADETEAANGRQRSLERAFTVVETKQKDCPIMKAKEGGFNLYDPRVLLGVMTGVLTIFEIVNRVWR